MVNVESIAIIGDVHGEADRLLGLLSHPDCVNRRFVFVGDLINRGFHSRRVLDIVGRLQKENGAVVVRGNHEQAVLDVLGGKNVTPLLLLGGASTILDYVGIAFGDVGGQFREAFPREHQQVLERTVPRFCEGQLVVTHSVVSRPDATGVGGSPVHDLDFQSLEELSTLDGEFLIFGHFPQRSGRPLVRDHFACIDTGAGDGGPLTAFLWPDKRFLQC